MALVTITLVAFFMEDLMTNTLFGKGAPPGPSSLVNFSVTFSLFASLRSFCHHWRSAH